LRSPDVAAILQHGNARARDFQRRNGAARQTALVELKQVVERLKIVLGELQLGFGFQYVNARQRDIEPHLSDSLGKLRFGDSFRFVRDFRAQLPLVGALERHVDPNGILRRTRSIDFVEACTEPVETVGAS
jgi:hypothetical protein